MVIGKESDHYSCLQGEERNDMLSKSLKLIHPPIHVQMMYSYHLTITLLNEKAYPWFYSNFIQLKCYPSDLITNQTNSIKFYQGKVNFNPWLKDHESLEDKGNLIASIIVKIRDSYYIECPIDEYYIPNLRFGGIKHYFHRVLVYGYDTTTKQLNIVGFKNNDIYGETTCTFEEFENALYSSEPQNGHQKETIKLFRVPNIPSDIELDIARISLLLNDYLTGSVTLGHEQESDAKDNPIYGIHTYSFLTKSLELLSDDIGRIDIRGYQALWEHKKIMSKRLEILQGKGMLLERSLYKKFDDVVRSAEILRNMALAAYENKTGHILNKMKDKISYIQDHEVDILTEVKHQIDRL